MEQPAHLEFGSLARTSLFSPLLLLLLSLLASGRFVRGCDLILEEEEGNLEGAERTHRWLHCERCLAQLRADVE